MVPLAGAVKGLPSNQEAHVHPLASADSAPYAPEPIAQQEEPDVHAHGGLILVRKAPPPEISPATASSPVLTLFTHGFDPGPRPASFLVSILLHSMAAAVVWFSLMYTPPSARVSTERFPVRQLDLRTPDQEKLAAKGGIAYPGPRSGASALVSQSKPALHAPAMRPTVQIKPGPQTLVQADLPTQATLPQAIPLPQFMIWSPSSTPVKNVVAPLPDKPTGADVTPSLEKPNQETNLADVNIASSNVPSPKSHVTPGATSPVVVHLPQQAQLPPTTATQPSAQPTPAAILSATDLRLKEGTAVLPPVNEIAASNAQEGTSPGQGQSSAPASRETLAAHSGGAGAGQAQAAKKSDSGAGAAVGKPNAPTSAQGADSGSSPSSQPSTTPIALPKDGRFGAVVVGEALANQFPEAAGVWSGRIAYTAYLHVGLAKSWILQYSLPLTDEAAAGGSVARLDAPWPYNIVRPNLAPGSVDADAIMVHGFVNPSGRFETLNVVFPQAFPRAQFVLDTLGQWQFRPAMQDGHSVKVEVLLIIPEDLE